MRFIQPCSDYVAGLARDAVALWDRVWFTPADAVNSAVIRILTGLILLQVHLSTLPGLLDVIGPHAWLDREAIADMQRLSAESGGFSVWFHIGDPRIVWAVHGVFLVALACLTLGLFTRLASVLVWAGHLSHMNRGVVTIYGLDSILAMLTLYVMLAPSGAALSVDRWLKRRKIGDAFDSTETSISANIALRLLQFHLCGIYLFSGLSKLGGGTWWNGTAVYSALMTSEATLFDMGAIARHDWLWMPVSNGGSLATLLIELGFPILVWNRRLRPLVLACVIAMQMAFGFLLGLGAFQAAIFTALLSFFPPQALAACTTAMRGSATSRPPRATR